MSTLDHPHALSLSRPFAVPDFRPLIPRPIYLHILVSGRCCAATLSYPTYVRVFSLWSRMDLETKGGSSSSFTHCAVVQVLQPALCSLYGTCTTLPVPILVFYYAPSTAIYRRRWKMLLKSLDCKWVQSRNQTQKHPRGTPCFDPWRETLLECHVMYEHIITVAPHTVL